MLAPKTIAKKEISPKKANAGSLEVSKAGVYDPDLYLEWGIDSGARDYGDVDARIAAMLQGGERRYVDPDSSFEAQLKINYWRLHREKTETHLKQIKEKNKLQNGVNAAKKRRTDTPHSYDFFENSLEESMSNFADAIIEYKLETQDIPGILEKMDNQVLSHDDSRALLKASGADPQEALRGSILDAMLGTILLQLVRLPLTLAFTTAAAKAELPSSGQCVLRETGAIGKTAAGEILKPGVPRETLNNSPLRSVLHFQTGFFNQPVLFCVSGADFRPYFAD